MYIDSIVMKRILIVGAGYLQSFAIRKAKELGYYVLCVDGNPNALAFQYADKYAHIDITDCRACLEYAKKEKIDGVITAATDYSILTVSMIAKELGLPGLNYDVALTIKNKYQVRKRLFEAKADDTEQSYEVSSFNDIRSIADKVVYPVMVKPVDGSGSRGASKVISQEYLYDSCKEAMNNSMSCKALIESFIVGEEYGVESFVYRGNTYIMGIMKKWMTQPPYYAELGHAYPSGLDKTVEDRIRLAVTKAIKAIGIDYGPVNMDILVTIEGKVHVVDVGARMGGNLIYSHIIPIGTGIDYPGNVIRAAVGDEVDLTSHSSCTIATALLALHPGEVTSYPNVEDFKQEHGLYYMSFLKHSGDIIRSYHTNIDGCGYIVVTGKNIIECHNKAVKARDIFDKSIKRKLCTYL